ncbi:hypothetical protein [Allokutzneria sp. NRRL B-24872]|uniref:hypothetical protein n=1 Tax=Allokutzneria sp. NRRL B-24872 TaxID=1137961 RepID=UPI0011778FB7|nr:hypothetical protein [Allokutzneria sp. NRRL B-24872]
MDLLFFRRATGVVMVGLTLAFLTAMVIGAVRDGDASSDVALVLAGVVILVGMVFAVMRRTRYHRVRKDLPTGGPFIALQLVLSAGFVGGMGLAHTALAASPTIEVQATYTGCIKGRTTKCDGKYTVNGVEYRGRMPGRSESSTPIKIEVLAADPETVVTKSWLDIMFLRVSGILSALLAIGAIVRWLRIARGITAELKRARA